MKINKEISNANLFSRNFSFESLRFNIHNLSYLPRWIIVMIDCAVLAMSFFLTYFMFDGIGSHYIYPSYNFVFIFSLLSINIFFFWLFRTYSGIIRHSSFTDAIKLFFSQVSVLVFFLFFNFVFDLFFQEKIFKNTALFINIVISFCGLFLYRVIIKQAFEIYFSKKNDTKLIRTLIYGTDANAISVANALKFETPTRFKIV
ncbi:nucleoside-diphosphate sugar epimerase/dehydratase, partial [Flavobacterium sp.]|uniref:nucleoside-diphosphate sugar epimerase/dehydratase n=1 Tax=Flavobacterium sp. TaxID=239 RepID=UPI0037934DEE